MAKNIKHEGSGKAGTNGFDPERLKKVVGTVEGHKEELLSLQGEYMNRCRSVRQSIAGVYEEAKAHGIPARELKKVIKTRELEGKLEAIREDLEPEQQETYDQIIFALGGEKGLADSPLGNAAVRNGAPVGQAADDRDLRPDALRAKKPDPDSVPTAEEVGAENARKLKAGIKAVPERAVQ